MGKEKKKTDLDFALERIAYELNNTCSRCFEDKSECTGCWKKKYHDILYNAVESISLIENIISAQEASIECQGYTEFTESEAYYAIKEILRKEPKNEN